MMLVNAPLAGDVIDTVTVQEPLAGIVPPASATEPPPSTCGDRAAACRRPARRARVDQSHRVVVGERRAGDRERVGVAQRDGHRRRRSRAQVAETIVFDTVGAPSGLTTSVAAAAAALAGHWPMSRRRRRSC
jgi:hypothetical protein